MFNSSVWNDVPLEMDDKSQIVLIAKPFVEASTKANGTTLAAVSHSHLFNSTRLNFNKTDDFFSRSNIFNEDLKEDLTASQENTTTMPFESRFSNKLTNFRKKFFSKLLSL